MAERGEDLPTLTRNCTSKESAYERNPPGLRGGSGKVRRRASKLGTTDVLALSFPRHLRSVYDLLKHLVRDKSRRRFVQ